MPHRSKTSSLLIHDLQPAVLPTSAAMQSPVLDSNSSVDLKSYSILASRLLPTGGTPFNMHNTHSGSGSKTGSLATRCTGVLGLVLLAAFTASFSAVGCANMVESRAIEKFAANLDSANLSALKHTSSDAFSQKALRTADAMDDLKILNLPTGKTSVIKVEEVDPKRKRVTVEVGEQKKEIFYDLVFDDKYRQWVVDDVFMKQRKRGVTAYKSVTEQMDLLLSVREAIEAWQESEVPTICEQMTPEFAAAFRNLPDDYRTKLTKIVSGEKRSSKSTRPEASLDEKTAIVRLPRERGETVWTLVLQEGHWLVADIAIDSKEEVEQIPSVYKQSLAVLRCMEFLDAYASRDREVIKPFCGQEFYEGAIALGDLSLITLPRPSENSHTVEVKIQKARADFTLTSKENVIHVAMHRQGGDIVIGDQPPVYEVTEVSVYDIATNQEQHLTAVFTAQAMLELFIEAIAQRDITTLRQLSTYDFTKRVWSQVNDQNLPGLPLEVFDEPEMQILGRKFEGALTRFYVMQNGQELTYFLREQQGQFRIDDIEWKISGRPASVKMTTELMIPLQNFACAVSLGRDPAYQNIALENLQKCCSEEFNRVVWRQTQFVPNSGMSADTFLATSLKGIQLGEGLALVQLGDQQFGAEVRLRKEGERYAIDEILLVAGVEEAQRLDLRRTLKTQLAEGTAKPPVPTGREEVIGQWSKDKQVMRDSQVVPAAATIESNVPASKMPAMKKHNSSGPSVPSGEMPSRLPVEPMMKPSQKSNVPPAQPLETSLHKTGQPAVPEQGAQTHSHPMTPTVDASHMLPTRYERTGSVGSKVVSNLPAQPQVATQGMVPAASHSKPAVSETQSTADWAHAQFDQAFESTASSKNPPDQPSEPITKKK